MRGESPLERVNIELGDESPPSGRPLEPTRRRISTDELLGLLSSARRRRLVAYLHARDDSVSLSKAVAHLSESEADGERRGSVVTDFRHVHLPKLTDADVVRYDRAAEVLEAGPNAERAARLLESVTGEYSSESPAETCSTDAVFRLLADETRRFLCSTLGGSDERVDLDDLAERVAAWKEDEPVTELTADERRSAKIELQHKHLPMLADAEFIRYEQETPSEGGRPVTAAEWVVARSAREPFQTADEA